MKLTTTPVSGIRFRGPTVDEVQISDQIENLYVAKFLIHTLKCSDGLIPACRTLIESGDVIFLPYFYPGISKLKAGNFEAVSILNCQVPLGMTAFALVTALYKSEIYEGLLAASAEGNIQLLDEGGETILDLESNMDELLSALEPLTSTYFDGAGATLALQKEEPERIVRAMTLAFKNDTIYCNSAEKFESDCQRQRYMDRFHSKPVREIMELIHGDFAWAGAIGFNLRFNNELISASLSLKPFHDTSDFDEEKLQISLTKCSSELAKYELFPSQDLPILSGISIRSNKVLRGYICISANFKRVVFNPTSEGYEPICPWEHQIDLCSVSEFLDESQPLFDKYHRKVHFWYDNRNSFLFDS